jgi:hypothetical protein
MSDITLYFAPASRAFTPLWLLEELGLPSGSPRERFTWSS